MTRILSTFFLLLARCTGGPAIGMVQTGQALAASGFFGGTRRLSYTPRAIAAAPSTAAGRLIVVASGAPFWTERPGSSPALWRMITPNLRTLMRLEGDVFLFAESTGATLLDGRLSTLKSKIDPTVLEVK